MLGDVAVRGTRRGRRDTEHSPTRCGETPADWTPGLGRSPGSWDLSAQVAAPSSREETWCSAAEVSPLQTLNLSSIKAPKPFSSFSLHVANPAYWPIPFLTSWCIHMTVPEHSPLLLWASCSGLWLSHTILIACLSCAFHVCVGPSFCLCPFCSNVSYWLLFSDKTEKCVIKSSCSPHTGLIGILWKLFH